MRLRPESVRARLTLWYALALAAIILIFSSGVYGLLRQSLRSQLDGQVFEDAAAIEAMVSSGEIEEEGGLEEIEREGVIECFRLEVPGFAPYRSQAWQRAGLDGAVPTISPSRARSVRASTGAPFRLVSGIAVVHGDSAFFAVARPEVPLRDSLRRVRWVLATGVPVAVLIALAVGSLLAGRVLSPLQTMAAKVRSITADNLSDRLPVQNPDDELGRLAAVFNDMLSRLQDAFERLRRFTADASHELRTPLTAIRSVGEVALREGQDAAALRETIGSMLEEADHLARLSDDLLLLTRLDSGDAPRSEAPTEISDLVGEAVDCLRVLAEEKDQRVHLNPASGITAAIDRVTIRQAVINLLDNAIKYSPPGSSISLTTGRTEAGEVFIAIEDGGPGIPPEERSRIFERFYRMPGDSGAEGGGAGLGLAIARQAVENNGGRIEVEDGAHGGSVFRIVL